MKRRPPLPEVEARVRAALQARSETWTGPVDAARPSPDGGTPPADVLDLHRPSEVDEPRRGSAPHVRFAIAAAAAAVVLLVAGVAVRSNLDDPDVTSMAVPAPPEPEPGPSCGEELPVQVTVHDAEGPLPGPAPGAAPAEPGHVVQHWIRPEGAVEVRWPATPQRFYDLSGSPAGRAEGENSLDGPPTAAYGDPPRATVDIQADGSSTGPDATVDEDVIFTGVTELSAPCDVLELTIPTTSGRQRFGLRLTYANALPAGNDESPLLMPYEPVTLAPLVAERRSVDEAPDPTTYCGPDGAQPVAGRLDPPLVRDTPVEVLQAFLETEPMASVKSGYIEMIEPDGSITYGANPQGDAWVTLLEVVQDGDGWRSERWSLPGC